MSVGIILLCAMLLFPGILSGNSRNESVSYSEFISQVDDRKVDKAEINGSTIYYTLKGDEKKTYSTTEMNDPELVSRLLDAGVDFSQVPPKNNSGTNWLMSFLLMWAPLLLIWFGLSWSIRKASKK